MTGLGIYLLAVFLLLVSAIFVLRGFVRRDYSTRGRLSVVVAALQAIVFFVYGGFPALYLPGDWPVSRVRPWLRESGLVCIVTGLGILILGMLWLGLLRSLGRKTTGLIQGGFYRFSRNPQVLGCVLYIVGFVILWPSWYAAGWGLLFLPIIHVMVLTEEEHLLTIFGSDYRSYCERVPRYLGVPKRR
ncbi:MAG TPA: isoprenylcysteine carboxylmethyltransferase family protein [Anaerolineales bacterium]|nr:isoprenylcysteine carboxylmethyltransferase family protein [Anaerolineales bacterium]